jgi:outer membrane protein insertion porin family
MRLGLVAAVVCLVAGPALGQGEAPAPIVESIEWIGLAEYPEETFQYYLGISPGSPLDEAALARAIRKLWDRQVIDDLQIERQPGDSGGIKLVVRVKERQTLRSLDFKGLKKLDRTAIVEKMDLERIRADEGGALQRGEIERLKNAIVELYRDRGYRFADVRYDFEDAGRGDVRVVFTVDEGDKVKIGDIEFEGNELFRDMRLRWAMKKTKETNLITRLLKRDVYNPATFAEDLDSVRALYKEKGYKDVSIAEPGLEIIARRPNRPIDEQKRRLELTIPIDEGQRWRLGEITIEGNEKYSDEVLARAFARPKNSWLKASIVDKGVEQITDVYRNTGYLYSQVDARIEERGDGVADVIIEVYEGDQFTVRRLEFQGNDRTRDKVLRREVRVQEGQVVNLGALKSSLFKIRQLEYFTVDEQDPVEFVNLDTENKTVDLVIKGRESDRTEVLFGGGWSEIDGFFGQVSLSTRNFMGRGETAGINVQAGGRRDLYDLSYFVPWLFDRPQSFGAQVFVRDQDIRFTDNERYLYQTEGGVITYGRSLRLFSSLSLSLNRSFLNYETVTTDATGQPLTSEFEIDNTSLRPIFAYDSRDSRLEPTTGTRFALSAEYAGGFLGGDNNFWRPELELSMFRTLTRLPVQTVAGFKLEAGWIEPHSNEPLNRFERYLIGGDTSIRGFRSRTLTLRDRDGNIVRSPIDGSRLGGRTRLEMSLEYHILLGGPFRLVTFWDAGNVWEDSYYLDDLRQTAGLELRIFAPMLGVPLRFIYATNLDERPGDSFESFRFSIGTSF